MIEASAANSTFTNSRDGQTKEEQTLLKEHTHTVNSMKIDSVYNGIPTLL